MKKYLAILLVASLCATAQAANLTHEQLVAKIELSLQRSSLTPEQKILHAFNRLGYGPDPSARGLGMADFLKYRLLPNGTKVIDEPATNRALAQWVARNLQVMHLVEQPATRALASFTETVPSPIGPITVSPSMTSQQMRDVFFPLRDYLRTPGLSDADYVAGMKAYRKVLAVSIGGEASVAFTRALMARFPLGEAIHNFWTNHFNVTSQKVYIHMGTFQEYRNGIRTLQRGQFRNLLSYTAHHPAMLFYLDNYKNTRPMSATRGINENYAREVLELHTFGEGPNLGTYTQTDVYQAARVLTGLTLRGQNPTSSAVSYFCSACHDPGVKNLLGRNFPSGEVGQTAFFNFIANHPRTAQNIADKLVTRFVIEPNQGHPAVQLHRQALVRRLTGIFTGTHGHLYSIYEELFSSPEFWSNYAYQSKVKQPFEWTVSAYRAAGRGTSTPLTYQQVLEGLLKVDRLGQPVHQYAFPTGYKDSNAVWANSNIVNGAANYGLQIAQENNAGFWSKARAYLQGALLDRYFVISNRTMAESCYVNDYARYVQDCPILGAGDQGMFCQRNVGYLPLEQIRQNADTAIAKDVFDFEAMRPATASPAGLMLRQALIEKPDRVAGAAQPVRTHLGLMLASPRFLRK